jgi:hypothetical protein
MTPPRSAILLVALVLAHLLLGCMGVGDGPAKRFHETVLDMNKSTRWGQMGDAAMWVEPTYRPKFVETHARWGQDIQVADSEVVSVQMAPDQDQAVALVNYQWYLMSAMTLHTTVIQQRWTQVNEHFLLVSELVVQGDDRLLHAGKVLGSEGGESAPISADAESLAPPG